ncbi:MAG: DegT/DnrJ/EryC1/StrS family aminotransferase [Thermoproteota archaeon]|nr:DegT/DnrJ/EryC1/StrS family aminotransferase [Candidatus Brockarchaeota archaeon]MBO3768169.1 DegT/DnrJ/EryC1/StrS family aminotransferase [Candidatus Brockarchaeota archaeon]MBO3800872.1 DegT/DnrJ/EryC1/StrS family aminotransferase [Candidatus Brockarchaeota archaeon]
MAKLAVNGGKPIREKPFPSWPIFDEEELNALKEVLESGVWGIGGRKKKEFEDKFSSYQNAKYGVAVTNGTAALEIALRACGIGCGDEVITTPYTFMATATAILYVNAVPVFVDIEPDTYNIDPRKVEDAITEKTKAILPVHIGGRPANMDELLKIAEKNNLCIIEDACQAWGSEWRGRRVGAIGNMGAFSFQSSKNITSGEGGMIVTNDEELYTKAWSLHNCGRLPEGAWYDHYLPGGNYRMTEFQAAVLLVQLKRIDEQTMKRMENAKYLNGKLARIDGISVLKDDERITRSSYHLYIFKYNSEVFGGLPKEKIAKALQAEGIPVSVGYTKPLYKEPYLEYFKKCPLSCSYYGKSVDYSKLKLPVAEKACYSEGLWISQNILLGSREDMDDIVAAFEKIKENINELQ